jgi:hypothetical protein
MAILGSKLLDRGSRIPGHLFLLGETRSRNLPKQAFGALGSRAPSARRYEPRASSDRQTLYWRHISVAITPVAIISAAIISVAIISAAIISVAIISAAIIPGAITSRAIIALAILSLAIIPVVLLSVAILSVATISVAITRSASEKRSPFKTPKPPTPVHYK